MTRFRFLTSKFFALFRRREFQDRVDEELEFHIGMETEENIRRGMAPTDARAAARRKLGNTTQVCEEVHRMNTIEFLDETARNFRLSFRTLRANPGFALTAVLVLALGLGSATAMFSALDRILFRPLPYPDGDQIVQIGTGLRVECEWWARRRDLHRPSVPGSLDVAARTVCIHDSCFRLRKNGACLPNVV